MIGTASISMPRKRSATTTIIMKTLGSLVSAIEDVGERLRDRGCR